MPFPLLSLAGGRDAVDARNSLPTSGINTGRNTGMSTGRSTGRSTGMNTRMSTGMNTGRAGFQPANNNKNNVSNMNDEVRVYQNSVSKYKTSGSL